MTKTDADSLITKYGRGTRSGYPCLVKSSGKMELIEALHAKGVQYQRISEILLAEFNIEISSGTLGRHSAGRCKCHR